MRRAIIRDSEPVEVEQPIQYSLVQTSSFVVLEATVGDLTQSLLHLYPSRVQKVGFVSNKLGLPTGRYGSVVVEEAD